MFSPMMIRIDPRPGGTVEEINEHVPMEMRVTKTKQQPQYKYDCMDGCSHPLQLEVDNYVLTTVHKCSMDNQATTKCANDWSRRYMFSPDELQLISDAKRIPEVEWAIENSFDGIYVCKEQDPALFETQYKFAVYLLTEQATFWKLKYHGK